MKDSIGTKSLAKSKKQELLYAVGKKTFGYCYQSLKHSWSITALLAVARHCFPELPWSALELCEGGREHWDFLRASSAAQGLKKDRAEAL